MDQKSPSFKISKEEEPDSYSRSKREALKVDKINRRLTLMSLLLLFLALAMMFAGYVFVQKKFEAINSAGESGVKGLSEDLKTKYADLSQRFVKLEEAFKKEVAPVGELSVNLEETAASLRENLKKAEAAILEIKASKTDRKDAEKIASGLEKLEKAMTEIRASLDPVRTEVKTMESRIRDMEERLTGETAKMVQSVEKAAAEINRVQAEISKQSFNKIDQKTLDIALKRQQDKFQKDVSDIGDKLRDREEYLKVLERRIRELESGSRSSGAHTPIPGSGARPSPARPPGTSKPDPILEQNLD